MIVISLRVLENVFLVKEFRIDVLWGQVTTAYYEDLGGDESGGFWLGGLHLLEEFLEYPHQGLEVS